MKDKVVVTGDVTGNIGSCSNVSTDYNTGLFTKQTSVVNSCTGQETFASAGYFDGGFFIIAVLSSFFGLFLLSILALIIKSEFLD